MVGVLRAGDFTARKVPVRMAELLDRLLAGWSVPLAMVAIDRFSLVGSDGIHGQVRLAGDLFYGHQPTHRYVGLPSEWFDYRADPGRLAREAITHGLRGMWVRRCDLWPTETSTEVVAALVVVDDTLFVRVESSGAKREIENFSGIDHNAYSLLVSCLTRHLDAPEVTRWSDDAHRVGRDALAVQEIVRAHKDRGKKLQFGNRVANPQDPADALITALLSQQGEQDNEAQAIKMAGHLLAQLEAGGAPVSERQMPHGFFHRRETVAMGRATQERVVRRDNMRVPYFDERYREVLETVVPMHAGRASYVELGFALARLGVERRGQIATKHPTFQAILDDPTLEEQAKRTRVAESAKSFFTVATHEGRALAAAGASERAELLCGKLDLWQHGIYPYKLEVRRLTGRGRAVKGRPLRYDDADCETGWLLVHAPWGLDEHGTRDYQLDIPDEVWESSRQRLLAEHQQPTPTGAAAHRRERPRLLQFPDYYDGDFTPGDPPRDATGAVTDCGVRQWRVAARQNNSRHGQTPARKNCVIRSRSAAASITPGRTGFARRGWTNGEGTIHATFNLAELCRSLGHEAWRVLGDALEGLADVPVRLDPPTPAANASDADRLAEEIQRLEAAQTAAARRAKGARAERQEARGRLEEATTPAERQDAQAALDTAEADVADAEQERADCEARLGELRQHAADADDAGGTGASDGSAGEQPDATIDLATPAWFVAGLLRTPDGTGSPALADVAVTATTDWRFDPWPAEAAVRWSCTLSWPLHNGGTLTADLSGVINDARTSTGRGISRGAVLADAALRQGRDLDHVVVDLEPQGRRTAVRNLLDWLARTEAIPAPTARHATIDHPVALARQALHAHVTGQPLTVPPELHEWHSHFARVYRDPHAPAGESAACPDDLTTMHRLLAGLAALANPAHGATLSTVQRATGATRKQLIRWQRDQRSNGPRRPRYLDITDGIVRPLACPHHDCEHQWATTAVLLPEVWATGYGVLCPTCRRVPDPAWQTLLFPSAYVDTRYTRQTDGSAKLFDQAQTVPADPAPLELAAAEPALTTNELARQLGRSATWVRDTATHLDLHPHRHGRSDLWTPSQQDALRQRARSPQ